MKVMMPSLSVNKPLLRDVELDVLILWREPTGNMTVKEDGGWMKEILVVSRREGGRMRILASSSLNIFTRLWHSGLLRLSPPPASLLWADISSGHMRHRWSSYMLRSEEGQGRKKDNITAILYPLFWHLQPKNGAPMKGRAMFYLVFLSSCPCLIQDYLIPPWVDSEYVSLWASQQCKPQSTFNLHIMLYIYILTAPGACIQIYPCIIIFDYFLKLM